MDTLRDSDLAQAVDRSTQMLAAAEAGDWAGVTNLQAECDSLLRRNNMVDEKNLVTLLELQKQHQSVAALVGHARDVVAQELERHRRSHRALSAYLISDES